MSQRNFDISSAKFDSNLTRVQGGLHLLTDRSIDGNWLRTVDATIRDHFPEGEAEAFKVNPVTGNVTVYTTSGSMPSSPVFAREIQIKETPNPGKPEVTYGEAKPVSADQVQKLGLFSLRTKTVPRRIRAAGSAGSLQVNEAAPGAN